MNEGALLTVALARIFRFTLLLIAAFLNRFRWKSATPLSMAASKKINANSRPPHA